MKKCPYCGKKYADNTTLCALDNSILQVASEKHQGARAPSPTAPVPPLAPTGLILLGTFLIMLVGAGISPILPCAVVFATSIWAGLDAKEIHINKYNVRGTSDATTTFLGCLLLWIIVFPWYLGNRRRVLSGDASVRTHRETAGINLLHVLLIIKACFALLFVVMLVPALQRAKTEAEAIQCTVHAKSLISGILAYSRDHQNRLPGSNWCDAIQPYVEVSSNDFLCLSAKNLELCHYALNQNLQGKNLNSIRDPLSTVLLFETEGGWNKAGNASIMVAKPRHAKGTVVGFVNGDVQTLSSNAIDMASWK